MAQKKKPPSSTSTAPTPTLVDFPGTVDGNQRASQIVKLQAECDDLYASYDELKDSHHELDRRLLVLETKDSERQRFQEDQRKDRGLSFQGRWWVPSLLALITAVGVCVANNYWAKSNQPPPVPIPGSKR